MDDHQFEQRQLSKIDKFSLGTGLIGLVADVVSLSSLFAISNSSTAKGVPLNIWLLVLISILYSIAAINFYARRYFHNRTLISFQELSRQQVQQIERAAFTFTCLINVPVLIGYFIFAFFEIAESKPAIMSSLDSFFLGADYAVRPFLCGVFYGSFVAATACYSIHIAILHIYLAFDPLYRFKKPNRPISFM